jgi:hypothetical protein
MSEELLKALVDFRKAALRSLLNKANIQATQYAVDQAAEKPDFVAAFEYVKANPHQSPWYRSLFTPWRASS